MHQTVGKYLKSNIFGVSQGKKLMGMKKVVIINPRYSYSHNH